MNCTTQYIIDQRVLLDHFESDVGFGSYCTLMASEVGILGASRVFPLR